MENKHVDNWPIVLLELRHQIVQHFDLCFKLQAELLASVLAVVRLCRFFLGFWARKIRQLPSNLLDKGSMLVGLESVICLNVLGLR